MDASINLGDRVYLKYAVCGEPGCVVGFDRKNYAIVDWSADLPELGRNTHHSIDSLVIDEAFCVKQLGLAFEEIAA